VDEALRQAEINYIIESTDENLERFNRVRARAGLSILVLCKTCGELQIAGPNCSFCSSLTGYCYRCTEPAGIQDAIHDEPHVACDVCGRCIDCHTEVCPECDRSTCNMCDVGPYCDTCLSFGFGLCAYCEQEDENNDDD